jgi:hypothetical protein
MNDETPLEFPKRADRARLEQYAHYDKLYAGEHFEAFSWKGEKEFTEKYNRLRYIVANFTGLASRVMADMLFGETVRVSLEDKQNQLFVDKLFEDNQLLTQLYESSLANSRRGDSLFKVRVGQRNPEVVGSPMTIIIEEFTPAIYFPAMDKMATRYVPLRDILAMTFEQNGRTYLHKEIHMPGYILNEVYGYEPAKTPGTAGKIISTENPEQFGFKSTEETKVKSSLIFHIPNVRDGSGYFGTSDYKDLESLLFALNNRITKVDNILDKHSDPILAVPPGVLNEDGSVNRSALSLLEVDNENPGFNKPEYIVWNANLESAFTQIDKLVEMLFMFSEISAAGTTADKSGGQAESGRALKFRLLASIRKRNRKIRYYDQAIKDMIETALELAIAHGISIDGVKPVSVERPSIKWGDGIINDQVEQVDTAVKRVDAGLSTRADEIANLDDISPEKAKEKVKEID